MVDASLSSANYPIIDESGVSGWNCESVSKNTSPKSRIRSHTEISESPSSRLKRKHTSLPCDVPSSNCSCVRKGKRRKTCVYKITVNYAIFLKK